jgi:hypothetical protein
MYGWTRSPSGMMAFSLVRNYHKWDNPVRGVCPIARRQKMTEAKVECT